MHCFSSFNFFPPFYFFCYIFYYFFFFRWNLKERNILKNYNVILKKWAFSTSQKKETKLNLNYNYLYGSFFLWSRILIKNSERSCISEKPHLYSNLCACTLYCTRITKNKIAALKSWHLCITNSKNFYILYIYLSFQQNNLLKKKIYKT